MKKDIKNRWKYRLGKLMCVMLAATTLGGSIDAKTLADFQTETHETSEAESDKVAEAASEAELDKAAEATSESVKSAETETETESSETSEVTGTSEARQTPEIKTGTILEILDSDALSALDPVVIVQNTSENNDALLMRILQLQSVSARVRTADGEETIIRLSVDWNVGRLDLPQIDVSVAGEYEELGTIVFPDGYACADHILRTLRLPVHVVLPDSPVDSQAVDQCHMVNIKFSAL